MKFLFLGCLLYCVLNVQSLGNIERVSLLPSNCNNCGMTALGQVNIKVRKWYLSRSFHFAFHFQICGSSGEPCCGIVNIADFRSIQEGQIYDFTGDEGLEDCYRFPLDKVNAVEDFTMTVYHEGSDGGQFDWVEVGTSDGAVVRCYLGIIILRVSCVQPRIKMTF